MCSAQAVAAGLCMAGRHALTYRARSRAGGVSNTATIHVSVLQRLAAADVSAVCTLRVPGPTAADLPLDSLVAGLDGHSSVTNEVLWAARQLLQDSMQGNLAATECAMVRTLARQHVNSLAFDLERGQGIVSSLLSQEADTGILTIEVRC